MHTFRVTRNEDLEVEEDDAENLLAALEKELLRRRFGPPVRLEVEESIDDHILELLVSELGVSPGEVVRLPGPLDLTRPARHRRPRPGRAEVPRVRARRRTPQLAEVESASPVDVFKAVRRARRTPAPPLRLVLHLGAAVHRAGRRRPARAGDQADALPHLRRLPDHRGADRRRRGRQAGAGARRDQGPLRRAGEHPLGPQARARRLPRRLRAGRPQDALQARDGGARRARGDPPLRPHRHRQLQPEDRADVRGLRAAHRPRGHRRGRRAPVQQPVRASRATPPTSTCWSRPTRSATGCSSGSAARSSTTRPAGRRGSGSRRTPSSTRRSSTSSTAPRRPACRSTC